MNINRLNLNLLLVLDVLLSERHVTRASARLHITQSATSNALNQLRDWLQDDLLVRSGKEMLLTPYAESIRMELHEHLQQLQNLVAKQPDFAAITSKRIFHVGMSDLVDFFLLPPLLQRLQVKAPHIELKIEHVNQVNSVNDFLHGNYELVIGAVLSDSPHINKEYCISFGGVAVGRKDHPLLQKRLTLKHYLSAKHLRIHYEKEYAQTNVDRSLKNMGKQREVRVSLPHVLPALFALQHSDLIATLPSFLSKEMAKQFQLCYQPLPFNTPEFDVYMAWHRQNNQEPGLCWLRHEIQQCMLQVTKQIRGLSIRHKKP